jgi:Family of unknown function (DUF6492)
MIGRIEQVTGLDWTQALCHARDVSEYLLYGHFVRSNARFAPDHRGTTKNLCLSYWEPTALDTQAVERMLRFAEPGYVAFSAASISETPVQRVRTVLGRLAEVEQRVA